MISDGEQIKLETLLILTLCFTKSKYGLLRNVNYMTRQLTLHFGLQHSETAFTKIHFWRYL